jgi:hypothetical protein
MRYIGITKGNMELTLTAMAFAVLMMEQEGEEKASFRGGAIQYLSKKGQTGSDLPDMADRDSEDRLLMKVGVVQRS